MRIVTFSEVVFNCDWDQFQSLLNKGLWNNDLLKGSCLDDSFEMCYQPLHHITIAQDILLKWFNWDEEARPKLKVKAEKNDKFMKFFSEQCHVPMEYKELMWFDTYSYCTPEDPFEEVFETSRKDLINGGFSDLDINLYWAVYTLNFKWAEELLKMGANPQVQVGSPGMEDVYRLLDWMEMGPMSETDIYLTDSTLKYTYDPNESFGFFSYLIRYALFAEMHTLVNSYCPKKEK